MNSVTNLDNTRHKENAAAQNPFDALKAMRVAALKTKHKNFPAKFIPVPQYRDNTAANLTRCVVDYINLLGFQAERVNCTGRMLDNTKTIEDVTGRSRTFGTKKWIPTTGTPGTSDVHAVVNGKALKLEIKAGKDRQSDAQREYEQQVTKAGGVYYLVKNFPDFFHWLNDFIKTETSLNG